MKYVALMTALIIFVAGLLQGCAAALVAGAATGAVRRRIGVRALGKRRQYLCLRFVHCPHSRSPWHYHPLLV